MQRIGWRRALLQARLANVKNFPERAKMALLSEFDYANFSIGR
jgi:hypothetical protein